MASIKHERPAIANARAVLRDVTKGKVRPTAALRFVTTNYPSLTRAEIIKLGTDAKINYHTIITQYHGTKAGKFAAPKRAELS